MKNYSLHIIFILLSAVSTAQSDMDLLLKKYNSGSIPYISAQELMNNKKSYLVLDTRREEEFLTSHIPGAFWASDDVNLDILSEIFKENNIAIDDIKQTPIVVYCTVGIRSENYGERLKKLGFTNIQNLYGSIFTWKDSGFDVVNAESKLTDSIHTYSKKWGKYLNTGVKVH